MTAEHPHPLPPNEAAAVHATYADYRALLTGLRSIADHPSEMTVPADRFDLVREAFSHMPDWDHETGEPIVRHCVYISGLDEPREHLMFKGMKLIRGSDENKA